MTNLLLEQVEYKIDRGAFGTRRSYLSPNGHYFSEFRSHAELMGWPLFHFTRGINPETGRRKVASGLIAVGRLAVGGIAIGQASLGVIGIGQATCGLLFGFGQAALGWIALGQLAVGWEFAAGQLAIAQTVIAQLGIGEYALAQTGYAEHLWSQRQRDPVAVEYFQGLLAQWRGWLGL